MSDGFDQYLQTKKEIKLFAHKKLSETSDDNKEFVIIGLLEVGAEIGLFCRKPELVFIVADKIKEIADSECVL